MLAIASFIAAILLSSLAEYWIHRLMHVSAKIGARHRDHHRRNEGQGVIWNFEIICWVAWCYCGLPS